MFIVDRLTNLGLFRRPFFPLKKSSQLDIYIKFAYNYTWPANLVELILRQHIPTGRSGIKLTISLRSRLS